MRKKVNLKIIILSLLILFFAVSNALAYNSGNASGWSWAEQFGWISLSGEKAITPYGIQISSDQITGYAWSEKTGWISLNCLNDLSCATTPYGIVNDGNGNLSGYAWSEKGGWINFEGTGAIAYQVKIDSGSNFSGYAFSEKLGWINLSNSTAGYGVTESGYHKVTLNASHTVNPSATVGLDSGLVGYWSFDGPTISGTTIFDKSGNGNDGTNHGATPTVGKLGQAMSFDGTSSYITIGDTSQLVETVSFWFKPGSTTNSIIDLDGGVHTIDISSSTLEANGFSSPTIYIDGTATSTLPDVGWHYVTITTITGVDTTALTVGKISSNYFAGSIDEVRIYNRALSADEVGRLYRQGQMTIVPGLGTATIK